MRKKIKDEEDKNQKFLIQRLELKYFHKNL